ncbi:uncharacterized protein At3g60930, chloroplastic-like [Eutrema salsugineum]|uniref:uncharacterized protein At3g60930, chloroplastic-like n=1 Tax=Eutrema salsugineum TaxID=72664 RepID=UPI000CECE57E|nr:uncharacterized protein At3g60930, chloroplastic-like [Eutrema salsugineum]
MPNQVVVNDMAIYNAELCFDATTTRFCLITPSPVLKADTFVDRDEETAEHGDSGAETSTSVDQSDEVTEVESRDKSVEAEARSCAAHIFTRSHDGGADILTDSSHGSAPKRGDTINLSKVKAEEEIFPFDPVEAKREIERLMSSRAASSSSRTRVRKKRLRPDPPGSSLSSVESLEALRNRFRISEEVEFVVPRPSDRAHLSPPDHFTIYESFFDLCFLWFPISEVILRYLWKHGISIGQIMPRGLWHMTGILVRSYEYRIDIELDHLLNLLKIRKAPGGKKFYISSKARRKIISGFPSKDSFWDDCFFFVRVNGALVGDSFIRKTKTDWRPLVRDFLPLCPDNLFEVRDTLAANRTHWKRHFSLERVERARRYSRQDGDGDFPGEEEERSRATEAAKRDENELKDAQQAGNEAPVFGSGDKGDQSTGLGDKGDPRRPLMFPTSRGRPLHEAANRKRSAAKKGKGIVPDEGEPLKKRQKAAAGELNLKKLVVDDVTASAQLFFRVNNNKVSLPRPEKLKHPMSYAAMAQRSTKFIAAVNELLADYESDALKEEEKGAIRAELEKTTTRFEESHCRKNNEIASLKRQIAAKDALLESRVKIAQKEARRTATAKFQERLAEIEGRMGNLERAKRDENNLGQIRSNLVLIGDLQKPDASLDAEEEKLRNWEAELLGAEETFERAATDLREKLVVSSVSPDSVDSRLGTKLLEVTAALVGVTNPTGSNIDTPRATDLAAEGVPELRAGDQ